MNYQETLDFLYSQVPMFQNLGAGAYKPGLNTTLALAAHRGNPHTKLKATIHVAGTNGKGSTAHTIAAILQSAGYKTGLYTSPHLLDFRERIRVNGTPIDEQFVIDFVADYRSTEKLTSLYPTFFELTTIMAFDYFVQKEVDVAVIEVGLGGRLDCTNIISPELSIITNISLDHTALLGHTEPEIASEKAGIIKPNTPVVIGKASGDVRKVFETKTKECCSPIVFACDNKPYTSAIFKTEYIEYTETKWGDIEAELTGSCQTENAATILSALDFLVAKFPKINSDAVKNGFAKVCSLTGLMGRWMVIQDSPVKVICDTGHNIGGWEHLGTSLSDIASNGKLHIVLGFVNDKDINAIVDCLPRNAKYYFAKPSVERGRPAAETAAVAHSHGIIGTVYDSVAEAYQAANSAALEGSTIFVGGSTFVVADLLTLLK